MSVIVVGEDVIVLCVVNLQQEVIMVSLMDLDGNIYYCQLINNYNGYLMKVNIVFILEGCYILKVY